MRFRHRSPTRPAGLLLAVALCAGVAVPAQTVEPEEADSWLTLRQAVELAMAQHLAVRAEESKVRQAEIDVELVRQLKWPDIDFGARTGLVPEARGDIFDSPDNNTDLDGLGVFWRFEVGLIQPITTFGKIAAAQQAAESAVRLRMLARREMAENLGYQVVRGFWALEASKRGREIAAELEADYRKLIPEVESAVEDEGSDVDHTDLFEVRSLEYGIVQTHEMSLHAQRLALQFLESLLELSGLDAYAIGPVVTPALPEDGDWPEPLEAMALAAHPTLAKARAGLDVQAGELAGIEAGKRPDIFLALGATYAEAPNRTDQKNPFIFDPFNLQTVGAFVGLRWDLNLRTHRLRADQGGANREQIQLQLGVLEERTALEVAQALAEVEVNSILLDTARRSLKSAKAWVRLSGENWELGIGKVKRLLDAYDRYYELSLVVVEREASFHLALARLAFALGDVGLYLDWTENGTVSF